MLINDIAIDITNFLISFCFSFYECKVTVSLWPALYNNFGEKLPNVGTWCG